MNFYTQQSTNVRKTWILMLFFIGIILGLGFLLAQIFQDPSIVYISVVISLVMNLGSFWFSDKIALSVTGAKPADENVYRELHRILENISITAGLKKPRLYIIDEPVPNAFATGRNQKNAAVAVTTGLMQMLDRSEMEGVLAHELAHIGNKDILVSTIAVVLAGSLSMLADFFLRASLFNSSDNDSGSGNKIYIIVGIVVAILAPLFGLLLQMGISRKREYLADATAVAITRYPQGLAGALQKISGYRGTMKKMSKGTAHMFIASPFRQAGKKIGNLFSTHPPVEKRIAQILKES